MRIINKYIKHLMFLEINFENQYLGHFIIAGDPMNKGAKGKVSLHKGKTTVKLAHDK